MKTTKNNHYSKPKTFKLFLFMISGCVLTSCFAPMNLNYDSARLMEEGKVEVQASGSAYYTDALMTNYNLGFKLGFAPSQRLNVKMRLEGIMERQFGGVGMSGLSSVYFEVENKFRIINKHLAFSLPVGLYSMRVVNVDPRLFITFTSNDQFEFTVIPKCHFIFVGGGTPSAIPGVSAGFGISKDLNQWAFRPEIGYDGFLSFGAGFSYFIDGKQKK